MPYLQWTASTTFPTLAPGQSLEAVLPSTSNNYYFVQGAQVGPAGWQLAARGLPPSEPGRRSA